MVSRIAGGDDCIARHYKPDDGEFIVVDIPATDDSIALEFTDDTVMITIEDSSHPPEARKIPYPDDTTVVSHHLNNGVLYIELTADTVDESTD